MFSFIGHKMNSQLLHIKIHNFSFNSMESLSLLFLFYKGKSKEESEVTSLLSRTHLLRGDASIWKQVV